MDKEQITNIKKTRDSISCSLSTLKRELQTNNLTEDQKNRRIKRGIKLSKEFQELSRQLIELGCKCNAKSPYLVPEWWENYSQNADTNVQVISPYGGYVETDNMMSQKLFIQKEPVPVDLEIIVKNAMKSVLDEQEYMLNVAWTEGVGNNDDRANLISIINDYMDELGIKLDKTESMMQERINIYRYCGRNCCIIKKTIQFFINRWGSDTDVSFFCKKIQF